MASQTNARFSTYSGAPSLQPSLAPTFETTQAPSNRSSTQHINSRANPNTPYLSPTAPISEKMSDASGPKNYRNANSGAGVSTATLGGSTDSKTQDLKNWSGTLERMQDERLDKQRYVMSSNKNDEVSKLALGAKVERALARRMVGQDATFSRRKKRIDSEKQSWEVPAR